MSPTTISMSSYVRLNRRITRMADDIEVGLGGIDQRDRLSLLLGELIDPFL